MLPSALALVLACPLTLVCTGTCTGTDTDTGTRRELILVAALVLVDVENIQLRYPQMPPPVINRLMALLANQLATLVAPADLLARIGDYMFACLVTDRDLDAITRLG